MKISEQSLNSMFVLAGVHKPSLHKALIRMGKEHLKSKAMKDQWSPDNPTKNYCYVVSEFVYRFFNLDTFFPMKVIVPGDPYGHRYLQNPFTKQVIDLSVDQFDNYEDVNYLEGKKANFMPPSPSKRAKILHEYYMEEFQKALKDA